MGALGSVSWGCKGSWAAQAELEQVWVQRRPLSDAVLGAEEAPV